MAAPVQITGLGKSTTVGPVLLCQNRSRQNNVYMCIQHSCETKITLIKSFWKSFENHFEGINIQCDML